jgi:hypothetical protein
MILGGIYYLVGAWSFTPTSNPAALLVLNLAVPNCVGSMNHRFGGTEESAPKSISVVSRHPVLMFSDSRACFYDFLMAKNKIVKEGRKERKQEG